MEQSRTTKQDPAPSLPYGLGGAGAFGCAYAYHTVYLHSHCFDRNESFSSVMWWKCHHNILWIVTRIRDYWSMEIEWLWGMKSWQQSSLTWVNCIQVIYQPDLSHGVLNISTLTGGQFWITMKKLHPILATTTRHDIFQEHWSFWGLACIAFHISSHEAHSPYITQDYSMHQYLIEMV